MFRNANQYELFNIIKKTSSIIEILLKKKPINKYKFVLFQAIAEMTS